MTRCPVCRARFGGESVCYRCTTDLSSLLAIDRRVVKLEREAVAYLAAGNSSGAIAAAEKALALHQTSFAQALTGFASAARKGGSKRFGLQPV